MKMKNISIISGIFIVMLIIIGVFSYQSKQTFASAPSGLSATVATSSVAAISTTASTLIATTTGCAARIISTSDVGIMLTFSDYSGQTPTSTFGHWQGASTTVAYDSGLYGCGKVKAYSTGSQTITITETR